MCIKFLLWCGIISSLYYVSLNVIVPHYWPAYDAAAQTVSELSAVGAPTRHLWNWLCTPYTLMVILFACGVRLAAGDNGPLRKAASLLLVYGALGLLWPFAAMHQRAMLAAGGATFADTLHLVLGALTEIIFLLALGFAAMAFGKIFRIYALLTVVVLLVFGTLTFLSAPGVAANRSTPLIGVWERVNIGIFLLWMIVFAGRLLRWQSVRTPGDEYHPNR